jgi:hypothetical protein
MTILGDIGTIRAFSQELAVRLKALAEASTTQRASGIDK